MIASYAPSGLDARPYALKLDGAGEFLWQTLAIDARGEARGLTLTQDDALIGAGWAYEQTSFSDLTRRFSPAGELGWLVTEMFPANDNAFDVAATPDGGLIVVGSRSGSPKIPWIARLDAETGVVEWSELGLPPEASGTSHHLAVDVALDGSIYVAGATTIDGNLDLSLRKLNADGVQDWLNAIHYPGAAGTAEAVAVLPTGGAAITGQIFYGPNPPTGAHVFAGAFDQDGALLWSDTQDSADGDNADSGQGVAIGPLGQVHVVGYNDLIQGFAATYFRYDSSGELLCSLALMPEGNQNKRFQGVTVDSEGFVVATGQESSLLHVAKLTP